jgi:hypothetical protein
MEVTSLEDMIGKPTLSGGTYFLRHSGLGWRLIVSIPGSMYMDTRVIARLTNEMASALHAIGVPEWK